MRRVVWPNNFSAGERQSERQTSQRTCEVHDRLAGSSGNFIATSSCSVQRATCNQRQRATVAAKYFYLYFIAPVEQLQFICPVFAQASPAGQTQSASVLQQLLPLPLCSSSCSRSALLPFMVPRPTQFMFFLLYYHLNLGLGCLPWP